MGHFQLRCMLNGAFLASLGAIGYKLFDRLSLLDQYGPKAYLLEWTLGLMLIGLLAGWLEANIWRKELQTIMVALQKIAAGHWSFQLKTHKKALLKDLYAQLNKTTSALSQHFYDLSTRARFQKEKEVAVAIQSLLQAKGSNRWGQFGLSGFTLAAKECGGDWWGHFAIEEDRHCVILVDAMGHGVSAGLVGAIFKTGFLSYFSLHDKSEELDLSRLMRHLNGLLMNLTDAKITATACVLDFNLKAGELKFLCAGHVPPILIPLDPRDDRIKRKSPSNGLGRGPVFLRQAGQILGLTADASFEVSKLPLRDSDRVLLYSDGLLEGQDQKAKGARKLEFIKTALNNSHLKIEDMAQQIINQALNLKGETVREDDLSLVVVECIRLSEPTTETKVSGDELVFKLY